MKKGLIKLLGIGAGLALSCSALAACTSGGVKPQSYNNNVVQAFNAVSPADDLVSQTASADGQQYLVTVVTSSTVAEYRVNSDFTVGAPITIAGEAVPAAFEEGGTLSYLERAYEEALTLSGIAKTEVESFDFDKDTYMGESVYKVEIEDAVAEYTYIFGTAEFNLISSKTELKNSKPTGGESSYIGEDRAKEIALDAAGIAPGAVQNFTLRSLLDGGKRLYKAAFDYEGFRYTVEVDAVSGSIIKFSKVILDETVQKPQIDAVITEEEAKAAALAFAFPGGTDGIQVVYRKVQLDYEKGQFVYEIEFVADGSEYEFEISATDGAVLDVEIETNSPKTPAAGEFITREQAVAAVLEQAGENAILVEVEIDKEHTAGGTRYVYEVEVKVNGREYEYYVDAVTGEVTLNDEYSGNTALPALTEAEALQIALDDFKLTAESITSQKIKLEREKGRLCYDIELMVGATEYSMTVDASTGKILEREIDEEHAEQLPAGPSAGQITREQAIAAVKERAGADAQIKEVELSDEGTGANKRFYYEVEVVVNGREYEYYVDVETGEVTLKGELITGNREVIGEDAALQIALDYYNVSRSEARVTKVKIEEDDGRLIYEVEFKVKNLEYEFEIDALTGEVIECDRSFD